MRLVATRWTFCPVMSLMLLVGLTAPPAGGQDAASPTSPAVNSSQTLEDLLRLAIEKSPILLKAQQEKEETLIEETRAKALFWPQLRLETTHGLRNQDPSPLDPSESSRMILKLGSNVWNQGVDLKRLDLARSRKRKFEILYFQRRDELCLKIAHEYYRYSLLIKTLEIQKNQQRLIRRLFDLVSDEYLKGMRSRRDFLRFKSQAQRASLDLLNQRALIDKARLQLLSLAGLEPSQHPDILKVTFQPEDSSPSSFSLFKKEGELSNAYEQQIFDLDETIADLNEQISRGQLNPTLTFDLAAQLRNQDYWNTGSAFRDNESRSWGAFLNFNWTLWDGGELKSQDSIAILRNKIQKAEIQQRRINLQTDILKLKTDYLQLKENFKTSEELLVLEQNNFLFIEGEYRQSKATFLDFITGIRDLAEAQGRHWRNLFELKQAIASYHYYRGSLFRYLLTDTSSHDDSMDDD